MYVYIYFLSRFFFLLLDAIKKLSAKLASINSVDTRKATSKDTDRDAEVATDRAVSFKTSFFRVQVHIVCFSVST